MLSLYSKGTRIEQNCAKNVKELSDTEKERESGKSMVPLPLEKKEREKEKKKERKKGGTRG